MHELTVEFAAYYLMLSCALGCLLILLLGLWLASELAWTVYRHFKSWRTIFEAMELLREKKRAQGGS